ncbi:hypothetical protein [Ruegeria sp.]|uniref:hypothetical protein n=1 Tax=Ruegeria sp. TaxID=1879320 RepID=UPI003B00E57A
MWEGVCLTRPGNVLDEARGFAPRPAFLHIVIVQNTNMKGITLLSGVGFVRFAFNWPQDRGMRNHLIVLCAMEIEHFETSGRAIGSRSLARALDCEGVTNSLQDARFTLRVARYMPFLGFRLLGLKQLWLELMGCRIALNGRFPMTGLDTLRTVAGDRLNMDPVRAGKMTVDDLYRAYSSAPLIEHWQHEHRQFLEDCARSGRNPGFLRIFAHR